MSVKFLDFTMETSTTTGTGTLTLAGAVTGFQSFAGVGNGNTCYIAIWEVDANGNPSGAWEVTGPETYTSSGTTISRSTLLASSTGSRINFAAGTKRVALVNPAALIQALGGDLSGNISAPIVAQASAAFAMTGDISPAQITSNQNDYNPTGLSTASVLRLNTDVSRNITGLAGGSDGRIIVIQNIGTTPIVLQSENASSSAANRFNLAADFGLIASQCCTLQYDSTSSRWRLIGQSTGYLPDVQIFTSTGANTWTKPAGCKIVKIDAIGGGGGGGSGRKGAAGTARGGGAGGGGGAKSSLIIRASDLNATETATVGAGGTGGTAQSTSSTNGVNSGAGTNSTFTVGGSIALTASGAVTSAGGTNASSGQVSGVTGEINGGSGASGQTGAGTPAFSTPMFAGGGGGGGGGLVVGNTNAAGGTGNNHSPMYDSLGAGAGGTAGGTPGGGTDSNGANGTNVTANICAGGAGGGGGATNNAAAGGKGGNGGLYGGGGGGGAAGTDTIGDSGAGGNGANGIIIVTSW